MYVFKTSIVIFAVAHLYKRIKMTMIKDNGYRFCQMYLSQAFWFQFQLKTVPLVVEVEIVKILVIFKTGEYTRRIVLEG